MSSTFAVSVEAGLNRGVYTTLGVATVETFGTIRECEELGWSDDLGQAAK